MGGRPRRHAHRALRLIFVDSSVWIDHFRGQHDLRHVAALKSAMASRSRILVGDIVLMELLSGATDDLHAQRLQHRLATFGVEPMLDVHLAVIIANNYRRLRSIGITVRKMVDLVIGTYCIDRRCSLLHNDRDFIPMRDHLGLHVVEV